jgi:hypothetical protein
MTEGTPTVTLGSQLFTTSRWNISGICVV